MPTATAKISKLTVAMGKGHDMSGTCSPDLIHPGQVLTIP
jgi:nucleoid-associated protein YgaU